MKTHLHRAGILVLAAVFMAACSSINKPIGSQVTVCCPGNYQEYESYSLASADMPVFLRNYVLDEFESVFQEKGLRRVEQNSDVEVTLSYKHVNLNSEQENIDPFVRMESMNIELRYIAIIEIAIVEVASGTLVWAGNISRIHHVSPGEYMHEEGARPAFAQTFRSVLESYPEKM